MVSAYKLITTTFIVFAYQRYPQFLFRWSDVW